jgi:hypothetical protein
MKFLLIDFGASYIKPALYNKEKDELLSLDPIISPFQTESYIKRKDLLCLLEKIISKHDVKGVVICSILGGGWINNIYYSWKSSNIKNKQHCLISGLFANQPTYHIHKHHKGDFDGIKVLGYIKNIPIYSSLGDTNCVIEALDIKNNDYVINIGTGSQVISVIDNNVSIEAFIPAGRALLVLKNIFPNLFDVFKELSLKDIVNSNLNINLNIFPQSKKYYRGGSILNINENNFNIKNLAASIIKQLTIQYKEYLVDPSKNNIKLTGGIPNKILYLKEVFEYYYPLYQIELMNKEENTHLGLIKYIKKYL